MKSLSSQGVRNWLHGLHKKHVADVSPEFREKVASRLAGIRVNLQSLSRKEAASKSFLIDCSRSAREIGAASEFLRQSRLPDYDFRQECIILNRLVALRIEHQRKTKFDGRCASYGETLLNCYLEIYINLTVYKAVKEINIRPVFMTNPRTGLPLELDVLFEDFRLAFEFQGDFHYTSKRQMDRDVTKFEKCDDKRIALIPVNVSQLEQKVLSQLIANTLKDRLGLHDALTGRGPVPQMPTRTLLGFCKICERLSLASWVFRKTLEDLDEECRQYQIKMVLNNSRSVLYDAPHQLSTEPLSVEAMGAQLKRLRW